MKVVLLGTNGWYSTALGNTSCVLIDSERYYVVLDAGDGIYKLDEYIKTKKPIILFLSHLHLDHIVGLHTLDKFRFSQGIGIYGYEGTKDDLSIIRHPYAAPFHELSLKVETYDLREGKHHRPFPFTCKLLVHADLCLSYRFELDNKVVTYCTDTRICDNLYDLAEKAYLLIAESLNEEGWPHLRPEEAANVAEEAEVDKIEDDGLCVYTIWDQFNLERRYVT